MASPKLPSSPLALPIVLTLVAAALAAGLGAPLALPAPTPSRARAEAAKSPPDLRQRLAAARKAQTGLSQGVFDSVAYNLDVADRIDGRFTPQAKAHRARAAQWLDAIEAGRDPFVEADGEILMRGYRSPLSERLQGYGVYLPPDYDAKRAYPVLIAMHGGSANGNLFLGVVLGNNMNWKTYREHLWDVYEPRWKPDWIVVSPDGFGQVMWRWMGEQDVLDVLEDVKRHYAVDADRVVLSGLSNGGVGAYNIGMRHAWRFAAVLAIAGAPSWVQYAGGHPDPLQLKGLLPLSGMALAENAFNTDFRYFHGRSDGGPMKPRYVEAFGERIRELDVPFKEKWYDAGHDLLYLVHRHGRIYEDLAPLRRNPRPREVRLVTGDYRAARQHWLEVTRLHAPPTLTRLRGRVETGDEAYEENGPSGGKLSIQVDDACDAFMVHVGSVPFTGQQVAIEVNGRVVYRGERAALGDRYHLVRRGEGFEPGFPETEGLHKRPGLSGPLPDAYYGPTVHVYGTDKPEDTEALQRAAKRGASGWPLWLWGFEQPVMADRNVTEAILRDNNLVLYATPGSHRLLKRMADALPIRVTGEGVRVGERTIQGRGVGTRFIYPNPLSKDRYVIVQAAPEAGAVMAGHKLPDFLPDYVVYDHGSTRRRPRLLFRRHNRPPAMGYFDRHWQLPSTQLPSTQEDGSPPDAPTKPDPSPPREDDDGDDPSSGARGRAFQPPEAAKAALAPPPPTRFRAPAGSQAGRVARTIARRLVGAKNFRARAPLATWVRDADAVWSIEAGDRCLRDLARAGVRASPHHATLTTPVPTPVEVSGQVHGVWFRSTHEERTLLMSCEMARRLPIIARIAKRHGVVGIDVMSAYRQRPRASFHTMGLGLDLLRFWTPRGVLSVLDHFQETPDTPTCEAAAPAPARWQARSLHQIACALHASRAFSTVLTPNYNDGHRDHFHLDARPDDPRLFLR